MKLAACFDPAVYTAVYSYDTCIDQKNGAKCAYVTVDEDAKGRYSKCLQKAGGTECFYQLFKAGETIVYKGNCTADKFGDLMICSNGVQARSRPHRCSRHRDLLYTKVQL
ncbi:hypothetical protein PINS_up009909 [Pythium insidiosum]|nr:hypothetical protein PINS_up009909 [Pythium insidiosum]